MLGFNPFSVNVDTVAIIIKYNIFVKGIKFHGHVNLQIYFPFKILQKGKLILLIRQ